MRKDIRKVVGIDLGDRWSDVRVFDVESGRTENRTRVRTERASMASFFGSLPVPSRVVFETGTHSPWVSRVAEAAGHEVVVANARRLAALNKSRRKSDAHDTDLLLELGRSCPELLRPVRHRSEETQKRLVVIRMRDLHVRTRSQFISAVRSSAKSLGERVPSCSPEIFHSVASEALSEELRRIHRDTLLTIARATRAIRRSDREIRRLARQDHPAVAHLEQVAGVGTLTALAFVLVIEDPSRFRKSRDVGPYLGLVPRLDQSGNSDLQLPISKEGDQLMRRLLVQAAHHILGHRGPDTDLRRWGLARAERGGGSGKKRAVIGVARRLAVLLHRLWVTGEVYEPLRNANRVQPQVA